MHFISPHSTHAEAPIFFLGGGGELDSPLCPLWYNALEKISAAQSIIPKVELQPFTSPLAFDTLGRDGWLLSWVQRVAESLRGLKLKTRDLQINRAVRGRLFLAKLFEFEFLGIALQSRHGKSHNHWTSAILESTVLFKKRKLWKLLFSTQEVCLEVLKCPKCKNHWKPLN